MRLFFKTGSWIIKSAAAFMAFACAALNYSPLMSGVRSMPGAYYAESGEQLAEAINGSSLPYGLTVAASGSSDESLTGASYTVECRLFGLITIKKAAAYIGQRAYLVPCGQPVGISIYTQGVLVVGLGSFADENGRDVSPAADAGLRAGDIILAANGQSVSTTAELQGLIDGCTGSVTLDIERAGTRRRLDVAPGSLSGGAGRRIGAWIRDSTVGIGTLSFYDPETGLIAALGHAVVDIDTGTLLKVRDGKLVRAQIIGVSRGRAGSPGELHGTFDNESIVIGTVCGNTELGIFGYAEDGFSPDALTAPVPVAYPDEVHTGAAVIYASVDNGGTAQYACRIVKTGRQLGPEQKGLVIEITDQALLDKTGGIVQGMSGSPILQDGRLVGVVTHVFVNDPKKGYGAYAYWMYDTFGG